MDSQPADEDLVNERWFAHPEVQARVSAGHADIIAGRTTRVTKEGELRARLNPLK